MTRFLKSVWIMLGLLLLSACSTPIYYRQQLASGPLASGSTAKGLNLPTEVGPKNIAIFFDGTANGTESDTNVKKLHSLVTMLSTTDNPTATLYVEGVGVNNDALGAALGMGVESRILIAYDFLRKQYRKGDRIYMFGFSRGAYQARILASMLQYVGLPDQPDPIYRGLLYDDQIKNSRQLFNEMKDGFYRHEYPCQIASYRQGLWKVDNETPLVYASVEIELLGLWDTVGALGGGVSGWDDRLAQKSSINPMHVDIDEPNVRYGDQLRNVKHVLHAVSLDDDREWIFTPLLVTREHLLAQKKLPRLDQPSTRVTSGCQMGHLRNDPSEGLLNGKPENIREVWFPGAHSDVGGGYADSNMGGVSLQWMISSLEQLEKGRSLLPRGTLVKGDVYGSSHDPESGNWGVLYHRMNRNLAAYAMGEPLACQHSSTSADCGAPGIHTVQEAYKNKLCMHPSVFQRRIGMPPKEKENQYLSLKGAGTYCVKPIDELANPPIFREVPKNDEKCPVGSVEITVQTWDNLTGECK
jgi:uncharacterized protein (DUF2235 family)